MQTLYYSYRDTIIYIKSVLPESEMWEAVKNIKWVKRLVSFLYLLPVRFIKENRNKVILLPILKPFFII